MKRSTKILLFGGLICLGAGIMIMLIAGSIGGAKMLREVGSNYHFTFFVRNGFLEEYDDNGFSYFSGSEEFDVSADAITSIRVGMDGGAVEIREGNSENILVSVKSTGIQYSVEDGTLIIKGNERWYGSTGDLVIYLPKGIEFDMIEVSVGGGELEASGLSADKIILNIGAGEASVDGAKAETLDISVGAGETDFSGYVNGNLNLDCGMGEIVVDMQEFSFEDYNYDLSCSMGNITIDDQSYSGLSVRKTIDNGSEKNISMNCGMGEILLLF